MRYILGAASEVNHNAPSIAARDDSTAWGGGGCWPWETLDVQHLVRMAVVGLILLEGDQADRYAGVEGLRMITTVHAGWKIYFILTHSQDI